MRRIASTWTLFGSHVLQRTRCLTLLALLAVVGPHACSRTALSADLPGLVQLLSQAAHASVAEQAIAWEPSGGYWSDLLWGRPVLFLAGDAPERDLFRAHVRLSPEGVPLSTRHLRNLTQTPLGDDQALSINGYHAAFATTAWGSIQSVSLLDLHGMSEEARPSDWLDRSLLAITAFQDSGSFVGLGWTDIVFDQRAPQGSLSVSPESAQIELGASGQLLRYSWRRGRLESLSGGSPEGARAVPRHYAAKPVLHWFADTVRDEWGPVPVAWVERGVFALEDLIQRTAYPLFGARITPTDSSEQPAITLPAPSGEDRGTSRSSSSNAAQSDGAVSAPSHPWPPAALSPGHGAMPGEGEWVAVERPWLPKLTPSLDAMPPAYFYRTTLRPDPERPYAQLMLVAMDMRQLQLDMEAGYEDPKPLTGPHGRGRLPDDTATLKRVVATFNGGIETDHGGYGMMVRGRVLLPPTPGAASIVVTDRGEAGLGTWPRDTTIAPGLASFRQSLEPLIENSVPSPTGRHFRGWQLAGESVVTERSALCLSKAGDLFYAWGQELTGESLAAGLVQADCDYAVHLDMNRRHTGFVFTAIEQRQPEAMQLELAHPSMGVNPARYANWSAKDFFFLKLRSQSFDLGGIPWTVAAGPQPEPSWLPAVFHSNASAAGIEVQVWSLAHSRGHFLLRAGTRERARLPQSSDATLYALNESELSQVLFAVGLGFGVGVDRPGLKVGKNWLIPALAGYATLVVSPAGEPRLLIAGESVSVSEAEHAVQLPLLAEHGKRLLAAGEPAELRTRGALCWTPEGDFLLATVRHDSTDPAVHALLQLGCETVARPDRGSAQATHLHRAGSGTAPLPTYDGTTLYALGSQLQPSVFHWTAAGSEVRP